MRRKQLDLFLQNKKVLKAYFGGSGLKSHPKVARPISTKDLMHVVLKSKQAKGPSSFLRIEREIISLAQRLGVRLNVKLSDIVVMSNHIHIALRVRQRRAFNGCLRALSGLVVRKLLKNEGSVPSERGSLINSPSMWDGTINSFFSGRPSSRIVASGRKSWIAIARYFELNRLEKLGFSKSESRYFGLSCGPFPSPS